MNPVRKVRNIRTYSKNTNLVSKKRELISTKALGLFLEKGYAKTTIREIAEACGWTEGALYRYIGSKEDILHLILPEARVLLFQEYALGLGELDAIEKMRKCIWRYYKWQDETADRNIFYNREIHNFTQKDRRILLKSQSDYIKFFRDLVPEGVAKGKFHCSDPLLVAHNIVMLGFDWSMRRWFLKQYYTIDEYIEKQTAMFLQILTAKPD